MAKAKAKTAAPAAKKNWKLADGVGFNPDAPSTHREYSPAMHCVVLMQSLHTGTSVFGPFTSRDAAKVWLATSAEGEMYSNWESGMVQGVSFFIAYLDIPVTREGRD